MASDTKHLEITLETQVESVNLAEEMCLRVAEAAGFGEDDCYRIGMSVREGVINAFHYGNQERADKKIHLAVDLTAEKMIIHVLDEGIGFKLSDVPDPLAEENLLSTSGRGIFLMRAFMDEFDVLSGRTGGAEIVCRRNCPPRGVLRRMAKAEITPRLSRKRKEIDVITCDASRCGGSHRCGFERQDHPRRRQRFAAKDDSGTAGGAKKNDSAESG